MSLINAVPSPPAPWCGAVRVATIEQWITHVPRFGYEGENTLPSLSGTAPRVWNWFCGPPNPNPMLSTWTLDGGWHPGFLHTCRSVHTYVGYAGLVNDLASNLDRRTQ